jgi:hypothetical protein
MEAALYAWFLKMRRRHLPVSGAMLKEKAKHFAGILKESRNFNNSQGWLQKFKKRFGRSLKISGKKLSSNVEAVEPFKNALQQKIEKMGLSKDQIYNAFQTKRLSLFRKKQFQDEKWKTQE